MNRLMMMVLLLAGFWVVPVYAEEMTYYVWTDDQGVTHVSDTPPKNRAYETRAVDFDAGHGTGAANLHSDEKAPPTEPETAAILEQDDEDENGSRIVRGSDDSGIGKAIIMRRELRGEPGLGDVPDVPGVPGIGVTGTAGP